MRKSGSRGRGIFKNTPSPIEPQVTNLSPDISLQCHLPVIYCYSGNENVMILWRFIMEILRCENLTKIYGEGNIRTHALKSLSFSVEKGEFVSIVGPSGSGKSTLLHILGGVDKPTSGKVFIDGTEIHGLKEDKLAIFRRRQIGLIYQFYNLLPMLDVDENIGLPHLLDGRKLDRERLDNIVEHLGLTERRRHLPGQLSGGQQQRVSIARAIYNRPAILLADEPTGNLDRSTGAEIVSLLKEANRTWKQTLLLITHDENIALQADRMLCIEDGEITRDERIRSLGGDE